jgi:hypothetical protein
LHGGSGRSAAGFDCDRAQRKAVQGKKFGVSEEREPAWVNKTHSAQSLRKVMKISR